MPKTTWTVLSPLSRQLVQAAVLRRLCASWSENLVRHLNDWYTSVDCIDQLVFLDYWGFSFAVVLNPPQIMVL